MSGSSARRSSPSGSRRILGCLLLLSVAMAGYAPTAQSRQVSTYHYDNLRTGWNSAETTLTPKNVPGLRLLASVALDEQVDAQPLLVTEIAISGHGMHDVLYVATENNTVYALDAETGAILLTRNLGNPVPQSALPGQCVNNSTNVGITSTPVIDLDAQTLYVMAYTYDNNTTPTYRLHALSLHTLEDKIAPAVVSASNTLSDGTVYRFNASVSRQRSGLLKANDNIYAAFASFCDVKANLSRGWLLGWNTNLKPLPANHLDDQLATSPNDFFLSSIWMSGYGVAADPSGNLYFSTGNSDFSGTSYSPTLNMSESVVKLSPDLTTVLSFFTPSASSSSCTPFAPFFSPIPSNVQILDQFDGDTSSGGVMLLPAQTGFTVGLAVAAGKCGMMYLLNRENLGGFDASGTNHVLGTFPIGACWCGESYFQGPDSIGRVVSSGGDNINSPANIIVWKVQASPALTLVQESVSPTLNNGQDGGFFTSVSSNDTQSNTAVIWAVGRPTFIGQGNVTLYALDPLNPVSFLFSSPAGTWVSGLNNANIVPVVANGRVYVASFQQVAIFGLGAAAAQTAQAAPQAQLAQTATQAATQLPPNGHEVFGGITTVNNNMFSITTRTGAVVQVDATEAVQEHQSVPLLDHEPVRVIGSYDTSNVLHATSIVRVKASPSLWPPDR